MAIRINKWLSEMGVCSRRQADRLISQQQVFVNRQVAHLGMLVHHHDEVTVAGEPVSHRPEPLFILYYKPVGVVCTHAETVSNNIQDVISEKLNLAQRVFAVGRLDKASEGLLLLTNQGDVVNKIMKAEHKQPKTYHVWLDKPVSEDFISRMSSGVEILQQMTLPCEVKRLAEQQISISLVQGLNRQIRRMCKVLGYRVERLQRVSIMHMEIADMQAGDYRSLTHKEIEQLLKACD